MKKIVSLMLAIMMLMSAIPVAYATTTHTNGTQVEYNAEADNDGDGQPDNVESYTVTVPAKLAPASSGNVVAQGTWASARKLVVTADKDVTLTNNINAADEKVLTVTFPGIELVGSNTAAVSDTKVVSVGNIEAALFGTWEGVFNYNVEMVNNVELISFTMKYYLDVSYNDETEEWDWSWATHEYQAESGMTWEQWCESAYNTSESDVENAMQQTDIYGEDYDYSSVQKIVAEYGGVWCGMGVISNEDGEVPSDATITDGAIYKSMPDGL